MSQDNIFSQFNSYDELNRLIKTEYGTLGWSGSPAAPVINPVVRTDEWSLDLLGNWVGGAAAGTTGPPEGRLIAGNLDWTGYTPPRGVDLGGVTPDAADDTFRFMQVINPRNEIEQLDVDLDVGSVTPTRMKYDAAGNLEFDGQYFYQYDAWNRLIQINYGLWDPTGEQVVIGNLVKLYAYDGHGRLIRIMSPFPDPATALGDDFRTERLYYDGIRRIQEVVIDPVQGNSNGQSSEEEEGQIGGGTAAEHLEREYVWGPGDNGFDELLVQYDSTGAAWWAIMDAGGDLVALCDFGGGGGGSTARVVGQWTYDAYGAVLSADHLYPMALPHLGHKGLFLDRLDVGIVTGPTGPESPRLVPYAHSLYHNRNRAYSPALGRFFQRDPNATAQALLSYSSTGSGFAAISVAFSMEDMYGDGMNLYEYLGSNPWNRSDPLGLSWDPFDIVDDYLAEDAGSKAAFLERTVGFYHTAAYLTAYVASWLPHPAAAVAGEAAMAIMGEPNTSAWHAVKGVTTEMEAFMHLIGQSHLAALETAVSYAQSYGSRGAPGIATGGLTAQGVQAASAGGLIGLFLGGSVAVGLADTHVYVAERNGQIVYVGTRTYPETVCEGARMVVHHAETHGRGSGVVGGTDP